MDKRRQSHTKSNARPPSLVNLSWPIKTFFSFHFYYCWWWNCCCCVFMVVCVLTYTIAQHCLSVWGRDHHHHYLMMNHASFMSIDRMSTLSLSDMLRLKILLVLYIRYGISSCYIFFFFFFFLDCNNLWCSCCAHAIYILCTAAAASRHHHSPVHYLHAFKY